MHTIDYLYFLNPPKLIFFLYVSMFPFVLTVVQGHEIIFDSEDEENSSVLQKNENFAEEVVPRFTNRQFKEHFRMAPNTFEDFLRKLQQVSSNGIEIGHPEISLEKQAMITLWCLANTESFRSVSDRFGITKSTCWSILYRTCDRILQLNKNFKVLCWPTTQRANDIIEAFQVINGFPGMLIC